MRGIVTLACLGCESEIGQQVREALFGPEFWEHAALTLLPFPFLAGIAALVHFGLPGSARRRREREERASDAG